LPGSQCDGTWGGQVRDREAGAAEFRDLMARAAVTRISRAKVLEQLRAAAKKGDRAALTLAVDQMKTLALSPRYWKHYLTLLGNPLARLVDLLVIKQGDQIARQKGWKIGRVARKPKPTGRPGKKPPAPGRAPRGRRPVAASQPWLFPELGS
jgi:hypothetical protein